MASRTLIALLALVVFSATCSAFLHKPNSHADRARRAARAVHEADERVNIVSHDGLGSATFLAIPDDVAESLRQRRSESIEDGLAHFFTTYGAAFGITDETAKQVVRSAEPTVDDLGFMHTRLRQEVEGVPVFSSGITVHFAPGYKLTSAQGIFVPGLSLTTTKPTVAEADAVDASIAAVAAQAGLKPQGIKVAKKEVVVFKRALFAGAEPVETDAPTGNLAYAVRLHHFKTTYFAFVDAHNGQVLHVATKSLDKLNHKHYEHPIPDDVDEYSYATGDKIDRIKNPKSKEIVKDVISTYNVFASLSGGKYLSFNGKDAIIRSRLFIYRKCFDESECGDIMADASCNDDGYCVPDACPNAYWDSGERTLNFCQEFYTDDTVGHELGHGYMQFTGSLMGDPEPGALDEGMADIWGEVVDQLNMNSADDKSKPGDRKFGVCVKDRKKQSVRWLQGEDDEYPANHLGLRDMFSPQCFSHPPETTSPLYVCSTADSGGVHSNCGIVNRAFATLVDGAAFDYTKIRGLGLTKTAAIFWRAQSMYMQPFTTFTDMAFALKRACYDFLTTPTKLYEVTAQSGPWVRGNQVINGDDCVQLFKVIDLVNMHGSRCRGPSAVRSFKVKATTKNSITFQWMAPSTNFPASDPTSAYIIEYLMPVLGHVEWVNPTKIAGTATTYTLRNLAPKSAYTFRIRAVTKNGALHGPGSILATKTNRLPSAGIAESD